MNQKGQLQNTIQQLESKTSKTPQEEAELTRKKQELTELEKKLKELEKNQQDQSQTPPQKPRGLIIGGGVLAVVGLIGIIFLVKKEKNRKK